MSQVEEEREDMRQQLAAQKQQCRSLLQQIAALRQEQQHNITLGGGKNVVQFGDSLNMEACLSQLHWPLKQTHRLCECIRPKEEL